MPTPTNPTTPDVVDSVAATNKVLQDTEYYTNTITEAFDFLGKRLTEVTGFLGDYVEALTVTEKLSSQQTLQLGLLSMQAIKVRDSFKGATLSTAGFAEQLSLLGISSDGMLGKIATSADNALRLQSTFLHLSAATGNLSKVFQAAGPGLENMNALLSAQYQMMGDTIDATGLSADKIEEYYSALGAIPGALEATVNGSRDSGTSTNMLTAAIKAATGSGRDFKDIMEDMKVAFQDYGLTGESALRFSLRMGEISNNLGIDLKSVQSHLTNTANAFKTFADAGEKAAIMSEGLAKITNEYVQALKATGLSGNVALDVVKDMVGEMAKLNLGQKAFLSAQTGGPGGLMGAFQIEKQLREGKIGEVFDKARQQMQQQFGRIITLDEAASDPAAAAQLTKQIQILKSGPLGNFAKTDQDAYRILEAFKGKEEGKIGTKELEDSIVQQTMDKGTIIQEKSYTELTKIRNMLEKQRWMNNISGLNFVQSGFTAGAGFNTAGEAPEMAEYRERLKEYQRTGAAGGGERSRLYGAGMETGVVEDTTGDAMVRNAQTFLSTIKEIPENVRGIVSGIKTGLLSGDTAKIQEQRDKLAADLQARQAANTKPTDLMYKEASMIKRMDDYLASQTNKTTNIPKNVALGIAPQLPTIGEEDMEEVTPGGQVGYAARGASTYTPGGTPGAAGSGRAMPRAAGGAPVNGEVHVHVTGYCLKCKREIEEDPQTRAINPAS